MKQKLIQTFQKVGAGCARGPALTQNDHGAHASSGQLARSQRAALHDSQSLCGTFSLPSELLEAKKTSNENKERKGKVGARLHPHSV